MLTVNNFFAHIIKEICITKYGSDKELIPTFPLYEIYQYSDSVLKHLPKDSLIKIEKTLLYSKQSIYFNSTSIDRRIHNGTDFVTTGLTVTQITTAKANNANDVKIEDRISKFQSQLKDGYVYRIPL